MGEGRRKVTKPDKKTKITIEDFRHSGWKEAVDAVETPGYVSLRSSFLDAAKQRSGDGPTARPEVLRLLADACSMMLNPENSSDPFEPMAVMGGRRSAIAEDFEPDALELFAAALPEIKHVWLKARLADLLWVRRRDHKMARLAIAAYREIPLEDNLFDDGMECWGRAMSLARQLGANEELSELINVVMETLRDSAAQENHHCLTLSRLLKGQALSQERSIEVAQVLRRCAVEFQKTGDTHRAGQYYEACVSWFESGGDKSQKHDAAVAHAHILEGEAVSRQSLDPPNNLAASIFFEKAIQVYKSIPNAKRADYGIDERLARLEEKLKNANKNSLDQMTTVTTEWIDISEVAACSKDFVRGKPAREALARLAMISGGAQLATLKAAAKETRITAPLQSLIPKSYLSADGRVIAKRAGLRPGGSDDFGEDDDSCNGDVVEQFTGSIEFRVAAYILPALDVVRNEHGFSESDFISLAELSPIVPQGRERLVGKSLYFGFSGDFGTSLHLLVSQVEHIVREQLKAKNCKTTWLNADGVETENSLSALVRVPEMKKVFGEDLAFEIRALFCEPIGPNLRNDVAHGLVDDHKSESIWSVYAWRFLLRLVLLPMVQFVDENEMSQSE